MANGYVSSFLLITYLPILITMRAITKKEDQRLRQLLLRLRMRHPQRQSRQLWGFVSFSPIRYKQRKAPSKPNHSSPTPQAPKSPWLITSRSARRSRQT